MENPISSFPFSFCNEILLLLSLVLHSIVYFFSPLYTLDLLMFSFVFMITKHTRVILIVALIYLISIKFFIQRVTWIHSCVFFFVVIYLFWLAQSAYICIITTVALTNLMFFGIPIQRVIWIDFWFIYLFYMNKTLLHAL